MEFSDKHFEKNKNFVSRCIAGEMIIVPVRNNVGDLDSIYTLNELGTFIWDRIEGTINFNQLVESVCKEYEVDSHVAEKDIIEFLSSLESSGIIKAVE
jgi:hypothetical protein